MNIITDSIIYTFLILLVTINYDRKADLTYSLFIQSILHLHRLGKRHNLGRQLQRIIQETIKLTRRVVPVVEALQRTSESNKNSFNAIISATTNKSCSDYAT